MNFKWILGIVKKNNDAILLNVTGLKKFGSLAGFHLPWTVASTISLANPNFGQHPGPFTSTTSGSFPLFEYSPGMLSLFYTKLDLQPSIRSQISISYHNERWVDIASLSPEHRNQKTALQSLSVRHDSRVVGSYHYKIEVLHTAVMLQSWWTSVTDANMGVNLSLIYSYSF